MRNEDQFAVTIRPELLESIKEVLQPEETFPQFVEAALSVAVANRRARSTFIRQALASRDDALAAGRYATTEEVLQDLEEILRKHAS